MFKFLRHLFKASSPPANIFDKKAPTERHPFDRFQWNGGRLLSKRELDNYYKTINHQPTAAKEVV